ncbi:putative monovalent cation/H+ antiporter subunit D [compost metagenome]
MASIALIRVGMRHFWASHDRNTPQLRVAEGLPIAVLLIGCVLMTVQAGPVMRYMQNAADALHSPDTYIRAVLTQPTVPNPAPSKEAP